MDTLEDVVVLDETVLDDEPGCCCYNALGECGKPGTHRVRCRTCGAHGGLICQEHTAWWGGSFEARVRRFRTLCCGTEGTCAQVSYLVPL